MRVPPVTFPLFLPLKGEYYDAFLAGTKDTEYRLAGGKYNARTCPIGRKVTLSRGYGKGSRMTRTIMGYEELWIDSPEFVACYGAPGFAACIYLPKPKEEQSMDRITERKGGGN